MKPEELRLVSQHKPWVALLLHQLTRHLPALPNSKAAHQLTKINSLSRPRAFARAFSAFQQSRSTGLHCLSIQQKHFNPSHSSSIALSTFIHWTGFGWCLNLFDPDTVRGCTNKNLGRRDAVPTKLPPKSFFLRGKRLHVISCKVRDPSAKNLTPRSCLLCTNSKRPSNTLREDV